MEQNDKVYYIDFTAEGSATSLLAKIDYSTGEKVASVIGYYDSLKDEPTHKYNEYKASGLERGFVKQHQFSLDELNENCLDRFGKDVKKRMEVHHLFQVVEEYFEPNQFKEEQENNIVDEATYRFWKGNKITEMTGSNIFVYGANPEFRNGAGGAKAAQKFGAPRYGAGRGIVGNTFGLITKNLKAGYVEKETGIVYEKDGYCSVSPEQISANIDELYQCASTNPEKKFFISYQCETWPNGQPKKSLNGYTSHDMWDMMTKGKNVPDNIRFNESFKVLANLTNKIEQEGISLNLSKEEFTHFWLTSSEFSQWHPSLFKYKDIQFISAEQFMMYSKAKLFKDDDVAQKTLDFNNSNLGQSFINGEIDAKEIISGKERVKSWNEMMKGMKDLGRHVKGYSEDVWVQKRVPIVSVGSREKYSQNEHLKDKLMSTVGTTLVEASPYDKIYGIGLKKTDAGANDREQWKGLNLLGDILTKLRDNFKLESKPKKNLTISHK
jgi:ribA/ribD-fused uncharacterized protein